MLEYAKIYEEMGEDMPEMAVVRIWASPEEQERIDAVQPVYDAAQTALKEL
jgi:hypothetical protein